MMILHRKRNYFHSVALLLLTVLLVFSASTARASTVTWDSTQDFENNGSFGPPTSRLNIDTSNDSVRIADGTKDFLAVPTIAPVMAFNKVYTAGVDGVSIAVVSLQTKEVKTINLPGRIAGAVYNSVNYKLYVGNQDGNVVTVIDASSANDTVRTITLSGAATTAAYVAAYNPVQNKVYIVNTADRAIKIIDGVSDSELVTKTVTAGVTQSAFAGGQVFLTNKTSRFLNIVDANDGVTTVEVHPEDNLIGGGAPGKVGLRIPSLAARGITTVDVVTLSWDYECSAPNQKIEFQVRTADDANSLDASSYVGPGRATDKWYGVTCSEATTAPQTETVPLDVSFTDAVELQVKLSSDGLSTLALHTVRLNFETFPDLSVTPLTVLPNITVPNSTVSISSSVINSGRSGAVASNARVRLIGNGTTAELANVAVPALAPGASFPMDLALNIPAVSTGDYSLEICADSADVVRENNEADNCTSTSLVLTYPDLVVPSVSGPTSLTMGTSVSVTSSVFNQERVAAGGFKASLYLTSNGKDYFLGDRVVAGLAAGQTDTASTAVTVPDMPTGEDYYYKACADTEGSVTETQEGNNCFIGSERVSVYSVLPDLIVKSISGTVANGKAAYSVTIKNMGATATTASSGSTTAIYLTTDATFQVKSLLSTITTGAIAARGGEVTFVNTPNVPLNIAPKDYYIGAIADSNGKITEYNEDNNTRVGSQQYVHNDLVVTAVSGTVANGKINYQVTVKNIGNGRVWTANSPTASIYLSLDGTVDPATDIAAGGVGGLPYPYLDGGSEYTFTGSINVPLNMAAETYYIGAMADASKVIQESNEDNNILVGNQQYIHNDLIVTAVSGTVADGKINYQVTVKNIGNGRVWTVNSPTASIYLSLDGTIDPSTDIAAGGVGGLPYPYLDGGSEYTFTGSINVPLNMAADTYYIGAKADASKVINESNDDNNTLAGNRQYIHNDLIVTAVSGTVVDGKINYQVTVKNTGNGRVWTVNSPTASIYLSVDGTIDPATDVAVGGIGGLPYPYLDGGSEYTFTGSINVPLNLQDNSYYIGAMADAGKVINESNDDNNTLAGNQQRIFNDLVTTMSATLSGRRMTYEVKVKNIGNGRVWTTNSAPAMILISTDETITTADTYVAAVGSLPYPDMSGGGEYAFTGSVDIPASVPAGPYFYGSFTDRYNLIPESSDSNNASPGYPFALQ